jgi:hypothetical protein
MSFKKLVNIFVETEDDKPEPKPTNTMNTMNAIPNQLNSVARSIPSNFSNVQPQADISKFTAHFDDLFDKANLPGPDYYEFSKMVKAINAPGMSEDMKMTAAFAGLGVQGLTLEKLTSSAQKYVEIIDQDAQQFSATLNGKINSELESKKQSAKQLTDNLIEKERVISKLQQELADDRLSIERINSEVIEQENSIASKAASYTQACEARKNEIASDMQKINSYLNK